MSQINDLQENSKVFSLTALPAWAKLARMKAIQLPCLAGLLLSTAGAQADALDDFLSQKGLIAPAVSAPSPITPKASELVVHAMGFMGVPYKWGGNEAETGLDCSGFVRAVFRQITGIVLPRTSDRQAAATHSITVQELAPGDLVFFNTMGQPHSHVGIYIGDGKFVHAPRTGDRIKLERLAGTYWTQRFDGARRVLAQAPDVGQEPQRLSLRQP